MAYSVIPNVHNVPDEASVALSSQRLIIVNPQSLSEIQQNVTLIPGKTNEMIVNLTVTTGSGTLSSIQFKLSNSSELGNCMRQTAPTGCIANQSVSNQTLEMPLNLSSTYYLSFGNKDSTSKTVLFSSSLLGRSVSEVITRDGEFNFAALAVGGLGVLVILYGIVAKTVIPWE